MKMIVTTAALAAFLTVNARADLAYSAPGMSSAKKVTGNTVDETEDLGQYWKYTVEGIKWQLVAATPDNGFVSTNGDLLGSDGKTEFQGESILSVSINGKDLLVGEALYCDNIRDYIMRDVDFDTPIIFHDDNKVNVSVKFHQTTNMNGDSGSYAVVKGKGLKEPPGPEGQITAQHRSDDHCSVTWKISRSKGIYKTIEVDVEDVVFTTTSIKVKSNKGHGDNADGADSDNTGKAVSKWLDNGKITQEVADANIAGTPDADEGGGHGSAVSQN